MRRDFLFHGQKRPDFTVPPSPSMVSQLAAIFLDVDGVIDSRRIGMLDVTKLERLRLAKERFLAAAAVEGCVVVISSHWRLVPKQYASLVAALSWFEGSTTSVAPSSNQLHSRSSPFCRYGLHVLGMTPCPFPPWLTKRPVEILLWLRAYNLACSANGTPQIGAFVAVDDRDLLGEDGGDELRGRFVKTSLAGLTDADVPRIVEALSPASPNLPPVPGLEAALPPPTVALPFTVALSRPAGSKGTSYTCTVQRTVDAAPTPDA